MVNCHYKIYKWPFSIAIYKQMIAYVLFRPLLPSPYMSCFFMNDIQISWKHHDANTFVFCIHFFAEGYIPCFADKNCGFGSTDVIPLKNTILLVSSLGSAMCLCHFMSPELKTHQSQAGRFPALSSTRDDPFLFRNPSKQTRKGCIF